MVFYNTISWYMIIYWIFFNIIVHYFLKKQILKGSKFFVLSNFDVKLNLSFIIIITIILFVIAFVTEVCVGMFIGWLLIVYVDTLLAWLENGVSLSFIVSWLQKELHHFSSSSLFSLSLSSVFWVLNCVLNPLQELCCCFLTFVNFKFAHGYCLLFFSIFFFYRRLCFRFSIFQIRLLFLRNCIIF